MRPRFPSIVFFTAVFLGAIILQAGCATTGADRAKKTTSMMQTVEEDYKQAPGQIDATNASLENLVDPAQSDRKKAYKGYAENVNKMEKLGKRLDTHTEKMAARNKEYFAEWETSYTNPEIRELSERRRIEMRELYAKIPAASIGVSGALHSYLTDIREIQMFLANDLTPQGIDSIKPIAQRAVKDGGTLKETIKPVLAAIDQSRTEMVQGGTDKGSGTGSDRK
jgi:hypothetical protein